MEEITSEDAETLGTSMFPNINLEFAIFVEKGVLRPLSTSSSHFLLLYAILTL